MEILNHEANKISQRINSISDATAVNVEQTSGLPLLNVEIDTSRAAQYGLSVRAIQDLVAQAF